MGLEGIDWEGLRRKARAFFRGLEASLDEFVARTITRGEELLRQEREGGDERAPGREEEPRGESEGETHGAAGSE